MDMAREPGLGETLLSHSLIRMFGREFKGLKIGEFDTSSNATGYPRNQLAQILERAGGEDPRLARIYGFSYEGHYYKLYVPSVFVVHGPGHELKGGDMAVTLSDLGVEYKDQTFASEVRMWAYDRLDYSLRIDITSGWLEDILLNSEVANPGNSTDQSDMTGRSFLVGRSMAVEGGDRIARRRR
jgi:hypothetical protein